MALSSASVLAKTARDIRMIHLDKAFPSYGFARHKGYGTAIHSAALTRFGPCEIHRFSFSPVKLSTLITSQKSMGLAA